MDSLYVGVAREIITPEIGCQLYGYRPDIFSTRINDDLTATAFYFRQGETQAVMVSLCVCLLQTQLSEKIALLIEKETGIPAHNCILHATHTHTGPNVSGTFGWGDIDEKYSGEIFVPGILRAVKRAKAQGVPAKIKISVGESKAGINRRELNIRNEVCLGQNPWGVYNPRMTVISVADYEDNALGHIIHYGAHGTVAGLATDISRDWSGVMVDCVERNFGGIAAFFNGPEGDVGPRISNGQTTADMRFVAEVGGVAATDAASICRHRDPYKKARLSVTVNDLQIPLDKRIPLELARCQYEKYKNNTVNIDGTKGKYYGDVIASYENGYEDAAVRPVKQTIIRVGDVAFVSFPYELFSEIGMRIAQHSVVPYTLSLSNTNGSEGYFVTEDQICKGGYEIDMFKTSFIQPYTDNADWSVVTQTVENLKKTGV
ncbi:MAG: neutral/alkaline non-lysosomal ceramidase N-terminal domain-containing protein [Clostridia bacterium]|nr:neutral/alkaline non-lysosomal ceramidase N-terminal domain-containing protein [Clostridia bacterium]